MRKLIALALAAVTLTLGAPVNLVAQTSAITQLGVITGQAVDAGGRAVPGQRVELVQSSQVTQTTVTGSNGSFTFAKVAAGDYIVRVLVNGQPAGVRVSLAPGAAVANALIVMPSAAAPSAAFLGTFAWLLVGGLVGIGIVTAVVVASDDDAS